MNTNNNQTIKASRQLRRGFSVINIAELTVNVKYRERYQRIELGTVVHLDELDTPIDVNYQPGTTFWARAYQNGNIVVKQGHDSRWFNVYTLQEFAELFVPKDPRNTII
jgi:hypothetical protein